MSTGTIVDRPPPRLLSRPVAEIARSFVIDPRIPALVPGFDAPFFQAGLAGYSDAAMRLVARSLGAPFCITEALLDRTLVLGGKGRRREDPDLLAAECGLGDPATNAVAGLADHPIAGQVMGSTPPEMAAGAEILVRMGYDVIDVNLACPVKKIRRRSRGGHFMREPEAAIAILKAVREVVPAEIPCTVKLRRAWDDTPEMAHAFERLFEATYELGYAWATVHCRTVEQRYVGPGRWEFLRELVQRHPDRLIFGSGDIWVEEDIWAMLEFCGVQAVSVARGCIGNPWIFRQARERMAGLEPTQPVLAEQRDVLLTHFELVRRLHGDARAATSMRKFGIRFAAHHPDAAAVRAEFIGCSSPDDWHAVIERRYVRGAHQGSPSVREIQGSERSHSPAGFPVA